MRRIIPVLAAIVVVASAFVPGVQTAPDDADRTRVYVVVIDGLEPENVNPILMPRVSALIDSGQARTYTNALANMFTETNANHAAMMTGSFPDTSGMVANNFLDPRTNEKTSLDRPQFMLDETLFDAIESDPGTQALATAAVMGKAKLKRLFDCTRDASGDCGPTDDNPEGVTVNHRAPDFLLGASEIGDDFDPDDHGHSPAEPATGSGYALDNDIMDITLELQASDDPDFVLVNLGGVDGFQHLFGSRGAAGRAAIANADLQVGRLVDQLTEAGVWGSSALIVTADHSFQNTGDPVGTEMLPSAPEAPHLHHANPVTPHFTGGAIDLSALECSDGTAVAAVSHGGSASIYLPDEASDGGPECLAELRAQALGAGADEALYRLPNPLDGGSEHTVAATHPDWHLDTPRAGDLILTADDATWFVESRSSSGSAVAGNHGGPSARPIPFVIASGSPLLAAGTDTENLARPVDIAPTVAALLGVEPPSASVGRVLSEALAD